MTEQTAWLVGIFAVVLAGLVGFFAGRRFSGARERIEALEAEVTRQKDEISGYKREVEKHFDKTATLFVSMAGSYKELFEHLSSGYEQLSAGSARELFKDRVSNMLLGNNADAAGRGEVIAGRARQTSSADVAGAALAGAAAGAAGMAFASADTEPSAAALAAEADTVIGDDRVEPGVQDAPTEPGAAVAPSVGPDQRPLDEFSDIAADAEYGGLSSAEAPTDLDDKSGRPVPGADGLR
ncbi:DUF1043 family protein [Azoarcus communis]|uniref:YhcB family protein n=1 Tax=Parazoarcus communis TaxID=41977 RepID=UPI001459B68E|nr:DUF1043 family protein [Parazoarcus communis]NMG47201.1 DUF1043 family protein [Parazoarcus communis]